jgi:hypothetical protein
VLCSDIGELGEEKRHTGQSNCLIGFKGGIVFLLFHITAGRNSTVHLLNFRIFPFGSTVSPVMQGFNHF